MTSKLYILNEDHSISQTTDLGVWCEFMQNIEKRRVLRETIYGVEVYTVFLGLDHNYIFDGEPVLFETMSFGDTEEIQERCCIWDEAVEQHKRVVSIVRGRKSN